jgi:hypothetical protein
MTGNALARWGWLPIATALLIGCASSPPAERAALAHGVAADVILAGRFVASEEMEMFHPMGRELTHVAEAWRIFTFETAGEPSAQLRFAGSSTSCPPAPLDDRTYVVALRRGVPVTTLEVRQRGRLISRRSHVVTSLLLIACSPIDPAASDGFVRP